MSFKTRCYLVYGLAPTGVNARKANNSLNQWIKNEELGKIIYHEHFSGRPLGGIAVFEVTAERQVEQLKEEPKRENSFLYGWDLSYHPMTHSTSTERFVYQTQYTLSAYRGVKMSYSFDN